MLIEPDPFVVVEEISVSPVIAPNNPSSLDVTSCSITLGEASGQSKVTETDWPGREGLSCTLRAGKSAMPVIIRATDQIIIEKAGGFIFRLLQVVSDGFRWFQMVSHGFRWLTI